MPAVAVENLEKTYRSRSWKVWRSPDETRALNGISFSVDESEIFGIVGPNGAGKTTLINILSGLIYRDGGTVRVFGEELSRNRERLAERMNVATAYSSLTGPLTVDENLKVFGHLYDSYSSEKADELLDLFEISHLRDSRVWSLSAGQQTRANLCKAFMNEPELLLLDEATAGLDPHIAQVTRDAIQRLRDEQGTTILVTSHDMTDIDQLSDRMMFLHEGEILRRGTPAELKQDLHVKVLKVTVDAPSPAFRSVVEDAGGRVAGDTATFEVDAPSDIVTVLERVGELEIDIVDIQTSSPDLDQLFQTVARGEL
ncbi:MAG: ABC transporter ATP-binding protein [Candidatus Nanohaloarchaea archaeon]